MIGQLCGRETGADSELKGPQVDDLDEQVSNLINICFMIVC